MQNAQAAATYRLAQFESAPPVKIVQLLYAGAIRFLKQAQDHEPTSEEYRGLVRRAEDIICELRASLNHDPDPELSARLDGLYLFAQSELGRAIIDRDAEALDGPIQVLETLLEGWKGAAKTLDAQDANTTVRHEG